MTSDPGLGGVRKTSPEMSFQPVSSRSISPGPCSYLAMSPLTVLIRIPATNMASSMMISSESKKEYQCMGFPLTCKKGSHLWDQVTSDFSKYTE